MNIKLINFTLFKGKHIVFRVDFNNPKYDSQDHKEEEDEKIFIKTIQTISSGTFLDAFPCSLGFDKDFILRHIGDLIEQVFENLIGLDFFDVFIITRPKSIKLEWSKVNIKIISFLYLIMIKINHSWLNSVVQ
jgi:hypothetical protein